MVLPLFWTFVLLLQVHWVADFVLQTHWQATNKSKNNEALGRHVLTYTVCLFLAAAALFPVSIAGVFIVVNGALHFCTDYCTSRITSVLYAKKDWHNFFVVIGFDQLIHATTLAVTLWLFFGE